MTIYSTEPLVLVVEDETVSQDVRQIFHPRSSGRAQDVNNHVHVLRPTEDLNVDLLEPYVGALSACYSSDYNGRQAVAS